MKKNKSKYRIVDIKQTFTDGREKHMWKLQKKNIFGNWKDKYHTCFKYDGEFQGKVYYLATEKLYFDSLFTAEEYLAELKDSRKNRHFYAFGEIQSEKSSKLGYKIFDDIIEKMYFLNGDRYISEDMIFTSKEKMMEKIEADKENKVKEEEYLYLYDENIHEDNSAGWTVV